MKSKRDQSVELGGQGRARVVVAGLVALRLLVELVAHVHREALEIFAPLYHKQ
jgi:hypothetical protein